MRPPEIRTTLTRETPAFFDGNPELKEAYRKPVKNLPAEQQERAMTTIAAVLRVAPPVVREVQPARSYD
jgi:hypothetical protein